MHLQIFVPIKLSFASEKFCKTTRFYGSKTVEHNNRLKRRDNLPEKIENKLFAFMTARLMHSDRFFDAKFKQYPAVSR